MVKQPPLFDSRAQARHQVLVKSQVMPSEQHRGDDLVRFHGMVQIGAAEPPAGRTAAFVVQRPPILRMSSVAQVERSALDKSLSVAARARRQHAVEHIDAAQQRADDVARLCPSRSGLRRFDQHPRSRASEGSHLV